MYKRQNLRRNSPDPAMYKPEGGWRWDNPEREACHPIYQQSLVALVAHWIEQGAPIDKQAMDNLNEYPEYAGIAGGILQAAGIPGFLTNVTDFKEEHNSDMDEWGVFLSAWHAKFAEAALDAKSVRDWMAATDNPTEYPFELGRGQTKTDYTVKALSKRLMARKQTQTRFGDGMVVQLNSGMSGGRASRRLFSLQVVHDAE